MSKNSNESIFAKNIQRGIEKKLITISEDESKIIYHCSQDYKTNFKKPEEKIRASYFTELILDYAYPPPR